MVWRVCTHVLGCTVMVWLILMSGSSGDHTNHVNCVVDAVTKDAVSEPWLMDATKRGGAVIVAVKSLQGDSTNGIEAL